MKKSYIYKNTIFSHTYRKRWTACRSPRARPLNTLLVLNKIHSTSGKWYHKERSPVTTRTDLVLPAPWHSDLVLHEKLEKWGKKIQKGNQNLRLFQYRARSGTIASWRMACESPSHATLQLALINAPALRTLCFIAAVFHRWIVRTSCPLLLYIFICSCVNFFVRHCWATEVDPVPEKVGTRIDKNIKKNKGIVYCTYSVKSSMERRVDRSCWQDLSTLPSIVNKTYLPSSPSRTSPFLLSTAYQVMGSYMLFHFASFFI